MKHNILFSDLEIEFVKNNYGIITRQKISKILNKPEHQITKLAKELNLHSLLRHFKRIYKRNDFIFSKINLLTCYWAGFIAADGYIDNKAFALRVCLSKKDKIHLERLKDFLKYSGPLYQSKTNTNLHLDVISKQLLIDLENIFNIHTKKSLTLKPPKALTYEQSLAYIIGYIDGDGSIGYNSHLYKNKKYSYLRLRIIGTQKTLRWINHIFEMKADSVKHCRSKIFIISFNNKNLLLKLKSFAIANTLPILNRKWDIINL